MKLRTRSAAFRFTLLVGALASRGALLAGGVVIDEVHYHPVEGSILEFIELLNDTGATVDVSGWRFDRGLDYTIPEGTSVPAGGRLVVAKSPEDVALEYDVAAEKLVGGFESSLDNGGETLQIVDTDGVVRDRLRYDDQFPWPTLADGQGGSLERLCAGAPTMFARNWSSDAGNGPNPGAPSNLSACPLPPYEAPPVVINEIFYHPEDDSDDELEYIEIRNSTAAAISLEGWTISDGVSYTFGDVELSPLGTLVVARDAEFIRAAHGITNVVGDFAGALANGGERLAISDSNRTEVDVVRYSDREEWPPQADALGRSLEKTDPLADGNDPASWRASGTTGGTFQLLSPGKENTVSSPSAPPFVTRVRHSPTLPRSTDEVRVTVHTRGLPVAGPVP